MKCEKTELLDTTPVKEETSETTADTIESSVNR
jgi:hypothetical protein